MKIVLNATSTTKTVSFPLSLVRRVFCFSPLFQVNSFQLSQRCFDDAFFCCSSNFLIKKVVVFVFVLVDFPTKRKCIPSSWVLKLYTHAHTQSFSMGNKFRWVFLFNRFFFFQTRCTSLNIILNYQSAHIHQMYRQTICKCGYMERAIHLLTNIVHTITTAHRRNGKIFVELRVACVAAAHCRATVNKQLNRKEFQSNALRRMKIP